MWPRRKHCEIDLTQRE
uniref:Uncharacterized protein n=1 Tax=Rhizophora mucronata TaxID=61149 RepID=A0A2P2QW86_RHIMU